MDRTARQSSSTNVDLPEPARPVTMNELGLRGSGAARRPVVRGNASTAAPRMMLTSEESSDMRGERRTQSSSMAVAAQHHWAHAHS